MRDIFNWIYFDRLFLRRYFDLELFHIVLLNALVIMIHIFMQNSGYNKELRNREK